MDFADIHTHMLWGVDDGAKSAKQMRQMLDAAYVGGTRLLCLTPHYHPGYFGENREKSETVFEELCAYGSKYPDLELYLANELCWTSGSVEWLDRGDCRSLGCEGSVLVDFSAAEREEHITGGLERLLSAGYRPILAHVERYANLRGQWNILEKLKGQGVLFQTTAGALTGSFGMRTGWYAKELVRRQLADFVASDAHDPKRRPPEMGGAYEWISRKYGGEYARALCRDNARALFPTGKK